MIATFLRLLLIVFACLIQLVWSLPGLEPVWAQSADHPFRIELGSELVPRGGWAVQGYVYNDGNFRAGGVRLRVEVLDDSGKVIGEAFGWVYGDVLPQGRAYFAVPVPKRGAAYRVTVMSFVSISGSAP